MYTQLIAAIAWLASTATAETVHGAVVFSRHGDRTTKWYGAQRLTSLGASQNFKVGSEYRARYLDSSSSSQILGVSEDQYVGSQIFASAPDQSILLSTATAFLQGLYPPLIDLAPAIATQTLNNGTNSTSPLDGYQYVLLHGVADNSPDTIWIKGDDACPAYVNASKSFKTSELFAERVEATRDFYGSFYDVLSEGVYNIKPENMTYAKAYDIFDLINVARIHNMTSAARNVSDEDLFQLRTLADSAEHGLNWNESQPMRALGAETLSGAVLTQLNQTVASKGKLKFSFLAGSYDTFLAFFGLAGLLEVSDNFYGLPEYASTMSFELFSDDAQEFPANPDEDLRVRWLFKNGTDGDLTTFPLYGTGEDSLPWSRFVSETQKRAISDVGTWCNKCSAAEDFCAAYEDDASSQSKGSDNNGSGGMSNAVAGVIGAVVALVAAGLAAAIFFFLRRRKGSVASSKGSVKSVSTDATRTKV
ncbi:hypothetical protein BN1723_013625 [Verticillium longisporum]|uniref:Acid phosphatase n=1 Tax=Verticillium longisporum TaxID=100787 RepID=A0A0G4LUF1_VERLO|nr:hypothetical protein HYQ44_008784 [Verticillium longisporum]CRK25612.1 hypothetical protein BN1723_013625 [Verticillium longisporum]